MNNTTDWAVIARKLHQDCRALESNLAEATKQRDDFRDELSKVMPPDYKDWWQNDKNEWPLIARLTIENKRRLIDMDRETIERLERELAVANSIIKECLSVMPVGYIPSHTTENLPAKIEELVKELAENTTIRHERVAEELAEVTKQRDEWKELYERLNESLASNKRLFSNKLAEKVIDDQVKRIKFLEYILSKTQKELLDLKGQ